MIDNKKNNFISKSSKDGREESVSEHSRKVAYLAECNAPDMLKSTAKLTALLHDSGKNKNEFYYHIKKEPGNPKSVNKKKVDHSSAGGLIVTYLAGKKV